MMRKVSRAIAIAVGLASAGVTMAAAQTLRADDIETALSVSGWDIVHTATADDGRIVFGARRQDGWAVIHTLTGCDAGVCAAWTQTTTFGGGLVDKAVEAGAVESAFSNDIGQSRSLIVDETEAGALSLRGIVLGLNCASDCVNGAIDSFASATRVTYDRLSGDVPAAAAHTGFGGRGEADGSLSVTPMNHRQIAAIVAATEREAARGRTPPTIKAWQAETGTVSFPPLLPE